MRYLVTVGTVASGILDDDDYFYNIHETIEKILDNNDSLELSDVNDKNITIVIPKKILQENIIYIKEGRGIKCLLK